MGLQPSYREIAIVKRLNWIKMGLYKVKNLREGSRPGNWIKFWKDALELDDDVIVKCHYYGCSEKATDGAHVIMAGSNTSDKWYIVPLCHEHNCKFGEEFYVTGPLVPVTGGSILL